MGPAERVLTLIVGVGMVTTLILPGRQTPQVIGSFFSGFRGTLSTAMGTGKKV